MGYLLAGAQDTLAGAIALAGLFVVVCLLIVLLVRSVPNKLIMLGLLMTVGAILAGAFLPGGNSAAVVMVVLGMIVVISGVFCIVISFIAQMFKGSSSAQKKTG